MIKIFSQTFTLTLADYNLMKLPYASEFKFRNKAQEQEFSNNLSGLFDSLKEASVVDIFNATHANLIEFYNALDESNENHKNYKLLINYAVALQIGYILNERYSTEASTPGVNIGDIATDGVEVVNNERSLDDYKRLLSPRCLALIQHINLANMVKNWVDGFFKITLPILDATLIIDSVTGESMTLQEWINLISTQVQNVNDADIIALENEVNNEL